MLDTIDLQERLDKAAYDAVVPPLRRHLLELQRECWFARIPSVVVFEGWDSAGKGETISFLTRRLEPRGFAVHNITAPRTHERGLPWLWRFWRLVPSYGMAGIFDRSWYRHTFGPSGPSGETALIARCDDVVGFERSLADDGYVVVKFFLHLSERERTKRRKKLAKDPLQAQRARTDEWADEGKYDVFRLSVERALERTDTEWGPWTIVPATDARLLRRVVLETLATRWEHALAARGVDTPPQPGSAAVATGPAVD